MITVNFQLKNRATQATHNPTSPKYVGPQYLGYLSPPGVTKTNELRDTIACLLKLEFSVVVSKDVTAILCQQQGFVLFKLNRGTLQR